MKGKLFGVGVGPGDPELLTLKAVRIIEECEVLAVPQTSGEKNAALDIVSKVIDISKKDVLYLPFLMVKEKEKIDERHSENAEKIARVLKNGKNAALINLGDISIFSTFSYIQKKIEKMGFETEVCPGVPSFCAVAASVKTSLTSMKEPLHIIPALHKDVRDYINLEGTKVFMKAGNSLKSIHEMVLENPEFLACAVTNCGMENERVYFDLSDSEEQAGYFTTVIVRKKD